MDRPRPDTARPDVSWSAVAADRADELASTTRRRIATLVARLRAEHLTLATAESLTAGLAAYLAIDEPGAGDVVLGGIVAYAVAAKRAILGVGHDCDVVSSECASQMAMAVQRLFGAACTFAFTGVAGPDALEQHPVGKVIVAVRCGGVESVREHHFVGDPDEIRFQAIITAAAQLDDLLDAVGQPGSFGSGGSSSVTPTSAT